ncbi:condensation domain-containing protein [Oceaniglobus roseus]|uniref:condensation domain-containing protein n=1 Tax=Oceaniglobus roseus TaxID=1737570 RepID=UPI000C7E9475|nr:condensation domain-containing protein [Kandeliimicrobium roseum]
MTQPKESPDAPALFPATPTQERLWRLERDHGDAVSKNIAVQWELRGRFSDANVEAAFQKVFDRHEILRTAFEEVDGKLRQRVVARVPFRLGLIDLRGMGSADCEARIRGIAEELAARPFDMTAPGQLRACLVRFAPERAMLLIATHYGVFDGYSIRILGREVGTLLGAAETGGQADLPELPLQYGDYAAWRAACADSAAMDEARGYWHARLRGKPYFEVPTDRPRRPLSERAGTTLKLPMSPTFREDLERAAKALGTSPFALGAGVMAAALHAATGEDEVGFTTCVAGREEAELEHLIGVFVNPVVLRFDCADASVGDLSHAARRIVAEALAHGDYPIDDLARDLGEPLDPARTPFVAPFFSLQSVFVEEQQYGPVRIVSVPSHTPQVTHDIAVQVIGRDSGWHMIVDYDTGLFEESTVRRFADIVQRGFVAAFDLPATRAAALAAPTHDAANQSRAPRLAPVAEAAVVSPALPARAAPETLARLSAIWAESLGRTPDGAAAEFFNLGGNSMAALRMLARVEAVLGARIDIAGFFDDPTLGGLARKIDALLGTPVPEADNAAGQDDGNEDDGIWSLIPLRHGPDTAPLIVSINQPFLYHGLSRGLASEAEVVNLHVRDTAALAGDDAAVLERLLKGATQRIAERARGRRLMLIGHCVDGTLSLLIADRLSALGQSPDLVSVIDCWAPDANAALSARRIRLRRLGEKARRWGLNLRQKMTGEIGWTEFLSRNKLSRPLLERLGRVAPATEAEHEEWAVNARLVRLVKSMGTLRYGGAVAMFATGGQFADARPRLFGWQGRLPADASIFDIPGWHEYALKQHGAKTIAAVLDAKLRRGAA